MNFAQHTSDEQLMYKTKEMTSCSVQDDVIRNPVTIGILRLTNGYFSYIKKFPSAKKASICERDRSMCWTTPRKCDADVSSMETADRRNRKHPPRSTTARDDR
ncbi:hypothetical protein TNCV_3326911 [Trichonephila clavipes]|nr:hypothetical protein TNCV_3326911 [Trichonephila clavipes]